MNAVWAHSGADGAAEMDCNHPAAERAGAPRMSRRAPPPTPSSLYLARSHLCRRRMSAPRPSAQADGNEARRDDVLIDEYAPGAVRAGSMGWATCVADRCVSAIERGAAIGGTEAECAQCGELARCLQDQADSNWCPPDD